jgi:hypothetical protein
VLELQACTTIPGWKLTFECQNRSVIRDGWEAGRSGCEVTWGYFGGWSIPSLSWLWWWSRGSEYTHQNSSSDDTPPRCGAVLRLLLASYWLDRCFTIWATPQPFSYFLLVIALLIFLDRFSCSLPSISLEPWSPTYTSHKAGGTHLALYHIFKKCKKVLVFIINPVTLTLDYGNSIFQCLLAHWIFWKLHQNLGGLHRAPQISKNPAPISGAPASLVPQPKTQFFAPGP